MSLTFIENSIIGAHIPKDKTLYNSVKQAFSNEPMSTAQIYISSPKGYSIPRIDKEDRVKTRKFVELYNYRVYVHSCLLYNLNGSTYIDTIDNHISKAKTENKKQEMIKKKRCIPSNFQSTIDGLKAELEICHEAFGTGVVVHIGSGELREPAIKRIAATVETVLKGGNGNLLLENAAGEGNKIGSTLKDLKEIYGLINENKSRVFFCIDTCHLFAAGEYDIEKETEMKRFFKDFENSIGKKIKLIHLNDSKGKFGCKKDRHETIYEGYIFKSEEGHKSLKYLIGYCQKELIDIVLETPAKLNILTGQVSHTHDINKLLKLI